MSAIIYNVILTICHAIRRFVTIWSDPNKFCLLRIRLIGSFTRWYGRPVDLQRVVEKTYTNDITSWRSGDVPYQHIKVPISSVSNICFHIHTHMYGFQWSIPHLHITYYCPLRHSTWLRNVGHRLYYVALR